MTYDTVTLPSVSAIVVTYYPGNVLKECLYSLLHDSGISEIVIVDNGNDERMSAWLDGFEQKHAARVPPRLKDQGNVGFGTAVNLGAKVAKSDCLLIINPDAVLRFRSLQPLEAARQMGRAPCLVGGKLIYYNGTEQRGGRRELLTIPRGLISYSGLGKLEKFIPAFRDLHREKDPEPTGPVRMPVVSGAFCYISAEDYRAIEGFDEAYFLHVEDIDFCRRITEAGGDVLFTPHAVVMHYGSTSDVSPTFVEVHKAHGLSRYFRKFAKTPLGVAFASISFPLLAFLLITRTYLARAYIWLHLNFNRVLKRIAGR